MNALEGRGGAFAGGGPARFGAALPTSDDRPKPALLFFAPPAARLVPGALPPVYRPERDGIVAKPLVARELARELARLLAARPRPAGRDVLCVGGVALDGSSRRLLFARGGELAPTPTEY